MSAYPYSEERRERNKILAKKTRMKKKMMRDYIENQIKLFQAENEALRRILGDQIGHEPNLSAACVTPPIQERVANSHLTSVELVEFEDPVSSGEDTPAIMTLQMSLDGSRYVKRKKSQRGHNSSGLAPSSSVDADADYGGRRLRAATDIAPLSVVPIIPPVSPADLVLISQSSSPDSIPLGLLGHQSGAISDLQIPQQSSSGVEPAQTFSDV